MEGSENIGEILKKVIEQLNDSIISQKIDVPIDISLSEFDSSKYLNDSHKEFQRFLADIIIAIYSAQFNITREHALGEALFLLETYYPGDAENKYYNAYIDFNNTEINGHDFVLNKIVTIIKSIRKNNYINFVLKSSGIENDWEKKIKAAEYLIEVLSLYLEPQITKWKNYQKASCWKELLFLYKKIL